MIDSKLTEILERTAQRTNVGPAPIEAIRAGAARRRRRRAAALSALGVGAAAIAVSATMLLTGSLNLTNPTPPVATAPTAGMRLVGIGHAAIAVPEEWGTNQSYCGTPQNDTVLIDEPPNGYCQKTRPKGIDSVALTSGKPIGFEADSTFEIDGVQAERQRTVCSVAPINHVTVCSGTVFMPTLDVSFRAESSTASDEVGRILDRILVTPDQIGVPDPQFDGSNPAIRSGEKYAERLTALGLKATIETRKARGFIPGDILAVSPSPGTMLAPGTTVSVTVVAQP
ncbi:PASTA domain-containing protein [Kribbella sp. NPDC059898]|uniref:PASTA domain-containing protein n=1 Tax=Kribbella sp. NPDC059898 TaxID=3346995 RepID=UPI00365834F2